MNLNTLLQQRFVVLAIGTAMPAMSCAHNKHWMHADAVIQSQIGIMELIRSDPFGPMLPAIPVEAPGIRIHGPTYADMVWTWVEVAFERGKVVFIDPRETVFTLAGIREAGCLVTGDQVATASGWDVVKRIGTRRERLTDGVLWLEWSPETSVVVDDIVHAGREMTEAVHLVGEWQFAAKSHAMFPDPPTKAAIRQGSSFLRLHPSGIGELQLCLEAGTSLCGTFRWQARTPFIVFDEWTPRSGDTRPSDVRIRGFKGLGKPARMSILCLELGIDLRLVPLLRQEAGEAK